MIKEQMLKDLEELLNGELDPTLFPYQKGNSIRIGKFVVRTSESSYKIFDCEQNRMIAETFSKSAAVAIAKTLAKGKIANETILYIDKEIQKWYNDCMFYKHTIKKTKDLFKKEVVRVRYDIARDKTNHARRELDKYIYS